MYVNIMSVTIPGGSVIEDLFHRSTAMVMVVRQNAPVKVLDGLSNVYAALPLIENYGSDLFIHRFKLF
jgi:hypothetical protein